MFLNLYNILEDGILKVCDDYRKSNHTNFKSYVKKAKVEISYELACQILGKMEDQRKRKQEAQYKNETVFDVKE
jgi:hypothetical protein